MYHQSSKPAPGHSSYDHEGVEGDHSVIRKVVEEHGHAVGHHHHSGVDGHHVITHHTDGHVHRSEGHPHYEHAHEHIGIAHGIL
jgi:hypothetical protein